MKRILDAVAAAVGAPGRPELIQAVWLWILVAGGVALVTVLARLVGENGSGKSTIVTLLCRLYDPARGDIAVDGISLRDIDTMASRREIRVAFQDYAHYAMTARVLARRAHPDSRRAIQLARSHRGSRPAPAVPRALRRAQRHHRQPPPVHGAAGRPDLRGGARADCGAWDACRTAHAARPVRLALSRPGQTPSRSGEARSRLDHDGTTTRWRFAGDPLEVEASASTDTSTLSSTSSGQ